MAEKLGITSGSLSNALGRNNPQWDRWVDIANLLGAPLPWLLTGDTPEPWGKDPANEGKTDDYAPSMRSGPGSGRVNYGPRINVVGEVTAGNGWSNGDESGVGLWLELKPHWKAVRVSGSSAEPVILDGQCALIDETVKVKNGRIVCIQTKDGRAYCKRFFDDGHGCIVLAGLNSGQESLTIKAEDIERVSVVVGTVFTDSVAR